jgi:hypothetical protein
MYLKAGVALVLSNLAGLRGLLSPYLSSECPSKVSPCDFFLPKATETAERVHVVLPLTSPESLYNRLAQRSTLSSLSLRSDLPLNISPCAYGNGAHTFAG